MIILAIQQLNINISTLHLFFILKYWSKLFKDRIKFPKLQSYFSSFDEFAFITECHNGIR